MMDFNTSDMLLTKELLAKKQADPFDLHLKYSLSPAQLILSIQKLQLLGIAREHNGLILLTDGAIAIIFGFRNSLFRRKRIWREIPENMLTNKIKVGSAYTPNWRKLGTDLRKKQMEIRRGLKVQGRKG